MTTSNPTKEEELMRRAAKFIVGKAKAGRKPQMTPKEFHAVVTDMGLSAEELDEFTAYLETPLGRESFKKTVRLEMWRAGYRPRGWKG